MATDASGLLGRRRLLFSTGAAAVIVLGGIGIAVAGLAHHGGGRPGGGLSLNQPHGAGRPKAKPKPLEVISVTPANGASSVAFGVDLTVRFSSALGAHEPDPTLTPPVPGAWHRRGKDSLEFVPAGQFVPGSTEHLSIPSGSSGPVAEDGAMLEASFQSTFSVTGGTMLRVNELLAELDYLPYSFAPSGAGPAAARAAAALDAEPSDAWQVSRTPLAGSFIARFSGIPSQLAANFSPAGEGVATKGAIMAFESDHNLTVDGIVGPNVWRALLAAVAAHAPTSAPYDYLIVTETEPETLYVWRNGQVIYQSPANTGVYGATTELGTFPVYLRFTSTTMTGTNPDGSHYSDPDIPWVAYFNGSDAVHGFIRPGYGYPQSDGCVELPYPNAEKVFGTDPLGTLVTVTTGALSAELRAAPASFIDPAPSPTTTTTTVPPATTTTSPPVHHRRPTTTTTLPAPTTTTLPVTTTSVAASTTTVPGPSGD